MLFTTKYSHSRFSHSVFYLLLTAYCLLPTVTFSQQIFFNNRYDYVYSNSDLGWSIVETDTGYAVAGITLGASTGGYQAAALLFIDSTGIAKSKKTYKFPTADFYSGSLIKVQGGFAWTGSLTNTTGIYPVLMRLNNQGDTLWMKQYGNTAYNSQSYQCKQTADGGFVLAGVTNQTGDDNVLLIKTDSSGNLLWEKNYGIGNIEYGFTIDITKDSGYVIGGYMLSGPNYSSYLVRTDNIGNLKWQRFFSNDVQATVVATPDNGCIVATSWSDSIQSGYSFNRLYLLKYDSAGTIVWQNKYGQARYGCYPWKISKTLDGNLIITGNTTSSDTFLLLSNHIVGFIRKIDSSGNAFWFRQYDHPSTTNSENYLRDIKNTTDGGYVACGFVIPTAPDTGTEDMWVIKLDSCGCAFVGCDSTCGVTGINELQNDLSSFEVYPNPANGKISIEFSKSENARIYLYDMLGNLLYQSDISNTQSEINVNAFPSGIYVLNLEMQNYFLHKKIIIQH